MTFPRDGGTMIRLAIRQLCSFRDVLLGPGHVQALPRVPRWSRGQSQGTPNQVKAILRPCGARSASDGQPVAEAYASL
jgi:hypothetical protein